MIFPPLRYLDMYLNGRYRKNNPTRLGEMLVEIGHDLPNILSVCGRGTDILNIVGSNPATDSNNGVSQVKA